jgi:PhnB protein
MNVEPYLYFNGRCEEALNFYRDAIGANILTLMRFNESPEPCAEGMPQGYETKVMHALFTVGESKIMASDGMCSGDMKFEGVGLTLNADNDAEAERVFAALEKGGKVQMPITETFFATRFGMVADKFGVSWLVINAKPMH